MTTSMSESRASFAITAVFDEISSAAARGEAIAIPGFGTFTAEECSEREDRHPENSEARIIAGSRKLSFSAAEKMKGVSGLASHRYRSIW
jgi:DNA-binding protein HU-beta